MKWINRLDKMPDIEGKYLAASSYGIVTAWFTPSWSNKFQDCESNNDEGMEDFDGRVFSVTHWMPLPEPPTKQTRSGGFFIASYLESFTSGSSYEAAIQPQFGDAQRRKHLQRSAARLKRITKEIT